jgi:hypothetical protein
MQHAQEVYKVIQILVGKPEGSIQLMRSGHRLEDNIKVELK